jgi:phosphoglycerate dehydrogenase-like enzyme
MNKLYLADPAIRAEQIAAIQRALPSNWSLAETAAGATAILSENVDITAAMMDEAGDGLRMIALLDTGNATVVAPSTPGSAPSPIPIVVLPNTALVGVAEHAVMLIMALSRHLSAVARATNERQWLPDRSEPILTDQQRYTYNWIGLEDFGTLYGKTVGLVGLGLIGRATAARLRPFGMRLLYTQRNRLDEATEARLGVQWRSLDALLAESDFVSLHHRFQADPPSNDNHIGEHELGLMKPTAYLINTARGRLVDEVALVDALKRGQIAGAGLDVFRYEPLPDDHPLFDLAGDNVILTPHVGGAPVVEAWETIARELVEHLNTVS